MKIEDSKSLNLITNCFLAADKIRKVQKQPIHDGEGRPVNSSSTDALHQILQIIADYSPETYKKQLNEAVNKVNLYNNSYRNLKGNISTLREQGLNKEQFIQVLSIMHPVLSTRKQNIITKILKLNEILNS